MAGKVKLLIDTNIIFSLLVKSDPNHAKVLNFFSRPEINKFQLVTNDYILQESYTVLLFAIKNVSKTIKLIDGFLVSSEMQVRYFDRVDFQFNFEIFSSQSAPKLSFADCSLLAQAGLQKVNHIITLDRQLVTEAKKKQLISMF